jgi:hypothetical protein
MKLGLRVNACLVLMEEAVHTVLFQSHCPHALPTPGPISSAVFGLQAGATWSDGAGRGSIWVVKGGSPECTLQVFSMPKVSDLGTSFGRQRRPQLDKFNSKQADTHRVVCTTGISRTHLQHQILETRTCHARCVLPNEESSALMPRRMALCASSAPRLLSDLGHSGAGKPDWEEIYYIG